MSFLYMFICLRFCVYVYAYVLLYYGYVFICLFISISIYTYYYTVKSFYIQQKKKLTACAISPFCVGSDVILPSDCVYL